MFYVYVLKSPKHGHIYLGFSSDLRQRYRAHQEREHKGWRLVYYEAYRNEQDARDRERMLKHYGSGLGLLKKRIARSMDLNLEVAGEARSLSPSECRP